MLNRMWILLLVLGPGLAIAQQPPNMNHAEMMKRFQDPAAMQRMTQEAEAAQKCMESIDQRELDALQKRTTAASDEIDRLCAAGKKKEALAKGLALSREMQSNETVKKMRECTKGMSDMMKEMMPMPIPGGDSEPTDSDICS